MEKPHRNLRNHPSYATALDGSRGGWRSRMTDTDYLAYCTYFSYSPREPYLETILVQGTPLVILGGIFWAQSYKARRRNRLLKL